MTTTSVASEPTNLDESSIMNVPQTDPKTYMQKFNDVAMRKIFSYLDTKNLEVASRVCTYWNSISKHSILWRYVQLKGVMVYDWDKFIDIIVQKATYTLDCRGMLLPSETQDFWVKFISAIKKATKLHELELYNCPINVVYECIIALPQLSIVNASSIKGVNEKLIGGNVVSGLQSIILNPVNLMENLTELRLRALTQFKVDPSPSFLTFENLTNLRVLSLTSVISFPKGMNRSLETITTNLEHLEIGNCNTTDFGLPKIIKRFINLKFLRLEHTDFSNSGYSKDLSVAIRSLKKLKTLELINIEFFEGVGEELGMCASLDSLLIIPLYMSESAASIFRIVECLQNLSPTLKYFVWGFTYELLRVTDILINQYNTNPFDLSFRSDISHIDQPCNNIPILRGRGNSDDSNFRIMSVPQLERTLNDFMVDTKVALIKIPLSRASQIYLQDYFTEVNDQPQGANMVFQENN